MTPAVVLLSGGLDSSTVLAIARSEGYACHALTVLYGQRHQVEVQAARRVAVALGAVEHLELEVPLSKWGGSALTADIPVPKDREEAQMSHGIPVTYVPARNTVLLSLSLALAESRGALDLFVGITQVDSSGYPDCRPEFVAAFERLARLGTKAGAQGQRIRVHAPLMHTAKVDTIRKGLALGLDYGLTHSCYDPNAAGLACGRCDACLIRKRAFAELGLTDPALRHLHAQD